MTVYTDIEDPNSDAIVASLAALEGQVGEVQASPTENSVLERLKVIETEFNELEALFGEVQASPTSNSLLDRLKALKTSVDAIATLTGEVQASPTENTVLERLKALETVLNTLEGEASLRDVGSPVRITNNATSQSVSVPATAKAFWCQAEGDEVRLEIDGAASSTSTIRVPEDTIIVYPITGGTQTLYSYGAASSYSNVRFLG